ncbi:MAG: RNA polymerase sigma-I factor [Bacillota bacterium]|nr:RNA polymerase sigma-I factor [Bacillota bacterium]
MLNFFHYKKEKPRDISINEIISQIKNGDAQLKERFLNDYKPFIVKVVSQFTGKYIYPEESEEFSIAFIAFNEAIDNFNETTNGNFFSFSKQNIRWKLINYYKKISKDKVVYPFTYFENDNNNDFEERYLKLDTNQVYESIERKEQITNFARKLKDFDITFEDLIVSGPKHKDSKDLLIGIANDILANKDIFEKLLRQKNIPMNDLLKIASVSRRTIERNRKFIIAACLIFNEDFDFLRHRKNSSLKAKSVDNQISDKF